MSGANLSSGDVILADAHPVGIPAERAPQPGGRSTTFELIKTLYTQAPHATLYTPLCKAAPVLQQCHYLVSTDGERLSAILAYTSDSIEFAWSLPGRAETLRNLIVQVKRRLKVLSFVPVMETGRRSWSEMLGLQPLGRYFRALYCGPAPVAPVLPPDLEIVSCESDADLENAAALMNAAYPSLPRLASVEGLRQMTRAAYYYPEGWFFLRDRRSGRDIGLAVNGYCRDVGEGFVEWVQVLPAFRQRGLGVLLVQESVHRLRASRCITVAGSLDAPFAVGDLYEKCGFAQTRQWTILSQRVTADEA